MNNFQVGALIQSRASLQLAVLQGNYINIKLFNFHSYKNTDFFGAEDFYGSNHHSENILFQMSFTKHIYCQIVNLSSFDSRPMYKKINKSIINNQGSRLLPKTMATTAAAGAAEEGMEPNEKVGRVQFMAIAH